MIGWWATQDFQGRIFNLFREHAAELGRRIQFIDLRREKLVPGKPALTRDYPAPEITS